MSPGGGSPGIIRRLQIGDGELVVEEDGDGEPFLLVHGFPFDRRMWRGQRDAFPGMRLLLPDLRGHGESEPVPPPYTLVDMAEDLRQILDHLAIEQVVFAGLSMGGYIALAFAGRYPERLRALLLLDTHPKADPPEVRRGRAETATRARKDGVASLAAELTERFVGGRGVDPEVVALVRQMILDTSVEGMVGSLTAMAARPDSTPILSSIPCPTLVLVGTADQITPPAMARAMHAEIPGAELVEIPDAGHLAPLEQPKPVNTAILAFLRRHGLARGAAAPA
jgi:3-oxoadipate enol-lactonase